MGPIFQCMLAKCSVNLPNESDYTNKTNVTCIVEDRLLPVVGRYFVLKQQQCTNPIKTDPKIIVDIRLDAQTCKLAFDSIRIGMKACIPTKNPTTLSTEPGMAKIQVKFLNEEDCSTVRSLLEEKNLKSQYGSIKRDILSWLKIVI